MIFLSQERECILQSEIMKHTDRIAKRHYSFPWNLTNMWNLFSFALSQDTSHTHFHTGKQFKKKKLLQKSPEYEDYVLNVGLNSMQVKSQEGKNTLS